MAQLDSSLDEPQQKIIDYLDLQNNPNKVHIIYDLLSLGRISFCIEYKDKLSKDILSKVKSPELLELITEDLREIWDARFITIDQRTIQQFYNDSKSNNDQFDVVLTRLADHGCSHTKLSSQILFLIVELTFPLIVSDKNGGKNLWIYLTNDGLTSLNHFADDISSDQLNEELNEDSESPLYLALRDYYKNELEELFKEHLKYIDTKGFYGVALDELTWKGWLEGIKVLQNKIPPRQFKPFKEAISNMVKDQKSKISTIIQNVPPPSISKVLLSPVPRVSQSISQQISEHLQLNGNPQRNQIISTLLNNGRRALFQFEEDLIPDLFVIEKDYTRGKADTPLLRFLSERVYEDLRNILEQSYPELFALIHIEQQRNTAQFNAIVRRIVEYGTPYKTSSFALFFILQLLFDGITDDCDRDISRQLFECVINDGIEGVKGFEKYIAKGDLDKQLISDQSLLQCALRMYFREEVKRLFNEHGILKREEFYDQVTNDIIKHGWIAVMESQSIRNGIAPNKHQEFYAAVNERLRGTSVTQQSDNLTSDRVDITIAEISTPLQSCTRSEEMPVTSALCTLMISDHNQSKIEKEMKEALDAIIATDDVYSPPTSRSQFEVAWDLRMAHIRRTFGPNSFLDMSIQSVSQKYDKYAAIRINDLIAKATGFFQAPGQSSSTTVPDLLERWKENLFSDISNLAGNCVREIDFISSSAHRSSTKENYVCIAESERSNDAESRDRIKKKILQELIDDPLNDAHHLCLNRFLKQMHEKLSKSATNALLVIDNDDVLYEHIIGCINRTVDLVNNELRLFGLELSADFLSTMHFNAIVLLVIVHDQQREKELNKQLEELERKKPFLREYFLAQMTSNTR